MNRKIFTLLAGAFLMLVAVFSANAQPSAITSMPLKLGDPVDKLVAGANDYYYLRVNAMNGERHSNTGGGLITRLDTLVLYMGNEQANGMFPVFISPLGKAGAASTWVQDPAYELDWFDSGAPKTQESASALWCTVVNAYDQGQNITFDFTNKYQKNQLLEVEVNENLSWPYLDGYRTSDQYELFTPGIISAWNFSKTYLTTVEGEQPLYAHITADTVVVLCGTLDPITAQFQDVRLKIVSVDDVLYDVLNKNLTGYVPKVPGMLFFTLHEAMPFALDAKDFNTLFGSKPENHAGGTTADNVSLVFTDDVNPSSVANPFTKPTTKDGGALWAQHIVYDPADVSATNPYGNSYPNPVYNLAVNYTPATDPLYDIDGYPIEYNSYTVALENTSGYSFDELGYMYLRSSSDAAANFLYAKHAYYDDNKGGDQFLTFGFDAFDLENNDYYNDPEVQAFYDAIYPQALWRLIYYPSGDSIYINSFQATYLPTHNNRRMTRSDVGGDAGVKLNWTDSLTQSSEFYTFRATLNNLDLYTTPDALYNTMVARLKYSKDPTYAAVGDAFYAYYHRNYVTIQNLTGNVRIVTLGNGNFETNHKIDTWINAGIYAACKVGGPTDRATVPSDLYLIRSNDGLHYLRIPIYSGTDSAEWWIPEPDEHPELLPSYQWVVLRRYENANTSQITLINREFDGTRFGYIQLYNTSMSKFSMVNDFKWNNLSVNHEVTTFLDDDGTSTFIALPSDIKKNAKLGYEYVPRDVAQVNVYSLNYSHEYNPNRYIDWKGNFWNYPNTDTTIYVTAENKYDRLYFKIDTVGSGQLEKYGFLPGNSKYGSTYKIPDLVQLERQPYYLNFEDPYKLICANYFSMINGIQGEYAMGNQESINRSYLGTPIFNLRHTYHKKDADGNLVPYFALLQRVNLQVVTANATEKTKFLDYLKYAWNDVIANTVDAELQKSLDSKHTDNNYFKTGVFVAGVEENNPHKLKAMLRADMPKTISTFRLDKDNDPLYRRFDQIGIDYDDASLDKDAPKTLKFHWMDRTHYEMFENTGFWQGQKNYWENYGMGTTKIEGKKNYLGYVNVLQYPSAATSIYVDTAFIKRGTGPVKPQYLLMVDPTWPDRIPQCDDNGDTYYVSENYLRGRFLINATDSARGVGSTADYNTIRATSVDVLGNPIGSSYMWENDWERLVFTEAIHAYDYDALYLIAGVNLAPFMYDEYDVIDIKKLDAASTTKAFDTTKPEIYIRKIDLGNNDHKDAVFQMRLIERGANDFIIESETGKPDGIKGLGALGTAPFANYNRKWGVSYGQLNSDGPMIAPCAGGWIKEQNGTAIISRSDIVYNLANGLRMNVKKTEDWPTENEAIAAAAPTVIGGNNVITILGAAGKKVVVSNILGQTVAGEVLSSDNATISAPKGVVIVAIEGEAAVKTLVK